MYNVQIYLDILRLYQESSVDAALGNHGSAGLARKWLVFRNHWNCRSPSEAVIPDRNCARWSRGDSHAWIIPYCGKPMDGC
jgi:hypothetical protein